MYKIHQLLIVIIYLIYFCTKNIILVHHIHLSDSNEIKKNFRRIKIFQWHSKISMFFMQSNSRIWQKNVDKCVICDTQSHRTQDRMRNRMRGITIDVQESCRLHKLMSALFNKSPQMDALAVIIKVWLCMHSHFLI